MKVSIDVDASPDTIHSILCICEVFMMPLGERFDPEAVGEALNHLLGTLAPPFPIDDWEVYIRTDDARLLIRQLDRLQKLLHGAYSLED